MKMAIAISSIGIKVSYAFEAVAGTRPTSGYTWIEGVKEIPELNPAPDTLETTSFDNLEYKTYINGLKDLGGSLSFTANLTQALFDEWNGAGGVMAQYATAKEAGKSMWLAIDIPGISKACFFTVEPSKIGVPSASVNEVLETSLNMTPTGEPTWDTKPTYEDDTPVVTTVTISATAGSNGSVSPASITVTSGSTVTISGATLTCDSKTITATPASGYEVDTWTGLSNNDTVSADKAVTVSFKAEQL